jgi:hypothetical protein
MAQSFSLEEALGGASTPKAAPSRGFSLDDALGTPPPASIENLGSPMGDDMGSAIMAASGQPKADRSRLAAAPDGVVNAQDYLAAVARRKEENPDRSVSDVVVDSGITFLKATLGLPEAFVGLADIPTAGQIGKLLERNGYKPKEAREILDTYLSEAQQVANRKVKEAKGFGATLLAGIQNPSVVLTSAVESLPQMLGGAGVARGLLKAAPGVAPWLAGAIGEGVVGAGSAAEQMRQESKDGLLSGKQSLSALGSGAGTALFGAVGGRLANKLGLDDVDTMLAAGSSGGKSKSVLDFAKKAGASGVSEGVFEEMPQSAQEKMWMNYATDRPLLDGVPEASAMGLLAGAAMGMAGSGAGQLRGRKEQEPTPSAEQMARERGFLVPETRTERPAPAERPAATPARVEPTFDEEAFIPPAPKADNLTRADDDLTRQREQEQADVLELEGEPEAPEVRERSPYMDEAAKYDTPEIRLKQAEAFGEDVTGLIFGETESYGRAALKKRSLTAGYAEKMDNRNDASDAATVAFGTGNYSVFAPYEKLFPKTATKLKTALTPKQEAAKPQDVDEQPDSLGFDPEAFAEIDKPFSLAEDMEGTPAPLTSDVEAEIERLTKDQEYAVAERERLEKRTAGTSLMKVLEGSLNNNEISELIGVGASRKVGKNPFASLMAKKGARGSSIEDVITSGKLDLFLPFKMRSDHPDHNDGEAAEYIREKLRNNQFYTHETGLAIEQVGQDIESIERQIEELLSDDDINKELQYAANEQREIDQAAQEPAASVADGAAEQREAKAPNDELDKREAQLDREAALNEREARLLEERKRLEEERLKLESPTKQDVADQEERKAKAAETDERNQIRKESEAGAGQFELTREEGRQDTTGGLFDQPEPEEAAISPEQERKEALDQFKVRLTLTIPPFRARSANKTQLLKPRDLTDAQVKEILGLASTALDLGLPPSVLLNVTAAGSTRMDARAVMSETGSLMIAKHWKNSLTAEKLQGLIHELGHSVDTKTGKPSDKANWSTANEQLKNWYTSSAVKRLHPMAYPFAPQFKGQVRPKEESFAQAFAYYFVSPEDLQTNAPAAYSQIQSIVQRIQDESRPTKAASTTKTGAAGVNVQPSRATEGAAVQPDTSKVGPAVGATARRQDRGAGEVTKTPAFRKWFGDSKVMDADGEPLVVYHASTSPITEFKPKSYGTAGDHGYFYFAASEAWSKKFAKDELGVKPSMHKTYLSISNPLDLRGQVMTGRGWTDYLSGLGVNVTGSLRQKLNAAPARQEIAAWQLLRYDTPQNGAVREQLIDAGYDGLIMSDVDRGKMDNTTYVAFSPAQIKSAIGNSGAFNPEIQDINAAMAGENVLGRKPLANWTMPDATNLDAFIYSIQNKQIDMKRAVDAIKETVGQIDERFDPYMKETLFAGRTSTQTKRFLQNELMPLFEEMRREKVSMLELEKYLHNRHAQERNEQIAKVNPGMPDKGSGISTADAQDYLANLSLEQKAKYKKLASMVDAIGAGTRQLLVDSGLESQDTIDAWESTYDNYIPLNRDDVDYSSNHGMGVGQGYSVRGPASRRAVGSERKVVDILANIAMQRERNIVRAEKNRVAMALYGMAIQNPNPDFFLAVNPDAKKDIPAATQELIDMGFLPSDIEGLMNEPSTMEIDPQTGLAVERIHQMKRGADNVMGLRVNGENRYVFFNQNNERAKRMATALKNLDADQLGMIMSAMANATRFLAAMNTQYNPIFGAYNFLRDVSTAGLQLTNTPLAGKQAEVLKPKNVWGAMRGIYTDLRAERGGKAGESEWSKLWEEFQQRGGQTGFRDQFSSTAKRGEALQRIIDPSSWADSGLGKVFTAGGALKVPVEVARKAAAPIFNWLSDYNETMENAIRLSAYKTALDSGMSKDAAAVLAKELTVNFNRKGQVATQAGALYAFFNASVQGTTALARTIAGPAGKKIIAGGLMLGGIQAVLYSMAGFDEGEPPEFIREKNFVIPIGNGKYVAIPLPLGYNVIPNTARLLTQDVIRAVQGKKVKPTETVFKIFESLLSAFNPIGNAGWSFQTFAPTLADPFVALGENRDYTGKKIAREDFNSLDPTPGFTRYKESSTAFSRGLAEFMNSMSGGTKDAPGKFSPTPDQIDYLIGQIFGGVGREAMKIERTVRSQITGEELPPSAIPLAGRFYGDTKGSSAVSNAFYENLRDMNVHENTVKGMRKRKENVQEYYRENPEARMFEEAGRVEREIQTLRKRRRELVEKKAPKENVRAIEERITARMKRFNDKVRQREEKKK